jgi:hypothetical protein
MPSQIYAVAPPMTTAPAAVTQRKFAPRPSRVGLKFYTTIPEEAEVVVVENNNNPIPESRIRGGAGAFQEYRRVSSKFDNLNIKYFTARWSYFTARWRKFRCRHFFRSRKTRETTHQLKKIC